MLKPTITLSIQIPNREVVASLEKRGFSCSHDGQFVYLTVTSKIAVHLAEIAHVLMTEVLAPSEATS